MKLFKLGLAVVFAASFVALNEGKASAGVTPEITVTAMGNLNVGFLGAQDVCFQTGVDFDHLSANDDSARCALVKSSNPAYWDIVAEGNDGNDTATCSGRCLTGMSGTVQQNFDINSNYNPGPMTLVPNNGSNFCYLSHEYVVEPDSMVWSGCHIGALGPNFELSLFDDNNWGSCQATCIQPAQPVTVELQQQGGWFTVEAHNGTTNVVLLGPANAGPSLDRACFLTGALSGDFNGSNDHAACNVHLINGNWYAKADSWGDGEAACTATCILYDDGALNPTPISDPIDMVKSDIFGDAVDRDEAKKDDVSAIIKIK